VAWLGGHIQTANDYTSEFAPAMNALLAGRLHAFMTLQPIDGAGGSILLRAPGALAGKLLVGGQHAIFRFGSLLCELAAGALGLALARDMRERGLPILSRVTVVGLCVLAAAILDEIYFGHPEETLGATLCIGAVLCSGAGRPTLAGLMLGCAIINKPWGVLALAPVVLASQCGLRRLGLGAVAALLPCAALVYGLDPARALHAIVAASALARVAHPEDVWWPLAHAVHLPGTTPYYAPPRFLVAHARELAVLAALALSFPLARARLSIDRPSRVPARSGARARGLLGGDRGGEDRTRTDSALALLALLLLVRCMLDPSNHVYYQVPFVMSLLAWDSRVSRAPARALLAAGLLWLVFHTISGVAGLPLQCAAYMLVTLPFAILLLAPATAGALRWPTLPPWRLAPGATA